MKKIVKRFLRMVAPTVMCLMMGVGILAAPVTSQAANSSKTLSEAMAWCNSKLNQKVGSGQCVAFAQEYLQYLGITIVRGNACDWATASIDTNYLTRIKGATPQAGDILIWTGGSDGTTT